MLEWWYRRKNLPLWRSSSVRSDVHSQPANDSPTARMRWVHSMTCIHSKQRLFPVFLRVKTFQASEYPLELEKQIAAGIRAKWETRDRLQAKEGYQL